MDCQLNLFKYSNDLRLSRSVVHDLIPKYVWKTPPGARVIEREFDDKQVRVYPARFTKRDGQVVDEFLGTREEVLEDVLRYLCIRKQDNEIMSVQIDGQAQRRLRSIFSVYEIMHELENRGHTLSRWDIYDSLEKLQRASVEVRQAGRKLSYSILDIVAIDDLSGKIAVSFNKIVTDAIRAGEHRLFNYDIAMRCGNMARWLFKLMSQNYTYASPIKFYHFSLVKKLRECPLQSGRLRDAKRRVRVGLDELVELGQIASYELSDRMEGRKISDVIVKIFGSREFIKDMKLSNLDHTQRELGC